MTRLAAVSFLLVGSACGPYSYVVKAEASPLAGQKVLMIDSLLFQRAEVDGLPEDAWIAGQNDTWKGEWGGDQARASKAFAASLKTQLEAQGITLTPQANPQGATLVIKPSVLKLDTGGARATRITISVKLVDVKGPVLEEISTSVKVGQMTKFEDRLEKAAMIAAENAAGWIKERTAP